MIDATEANRLSAEARDRLHRQQLDRELAKCHRAVQSAIARGEWSCRLPIDKNLVSQNLVNALRARGYRVELPPGKRYSGCISWGAPLKPEDRAP